jgi:hypothetical protein
VGFRASGKITSEAGIPARGPPRSGHRCLRDRSMETGGHDAGRYRYGTPRSGLDEDPEGEVQGAACADK